VVKLAVKSWSNGANPHERSPHGNQRAVQEWPERLYNSQIAVKYWSNTGQILVEQRSNSSPPGVAGADGAVEEVDDEGPPGLLPTRGGG
jgi:hypothetical protein